MLFDASQDPNELWLYAERYLLVGTRTYSQFAGINEMDPIWQPDSGIRSIEIPCFWVNVSQNDGFKSNSHKLSPSVTKLYSPEPSRFLLPVHPGTIPLLPLSVQQQIKELTPGPRLDVSPTASTRTVYVHGVVGTGVCAKHFLKLHFPGRISRLIRSLTREDVMHQLWTSEQIRKARLPHLPDLAGGYALPYEDSSIGFLARSVRVENGLDDPFFTLPGYSLYGLDKNSPTDPPLLAQLPCYFQQSPADFIVTRIIVPAVDLWVRTVSILGIIPQLHGQNTLFCFSRSGSISSISFRDSDLFVDNRIRRRFGIEDGPLSPELLDDNSERTPEQVLSLCYDGFLVHHFLTRVATFANDWFGIPVSTCRDAAILAFRAAGGGALPFGNAIYYYDDRLCTNEDEPPLVEKPSFELWR